MDAAGMQASSGLSRLAGAASAIDRALLRQLSLVGMPEGPEAAGHLVLPLAVLQMPPVILARLLASAIGLVAIPGYIPGRDALARLAMRLRDKRPSTLGGARFNPLREGWLAVSYTHLTLPTTVFV